MRTLVLPKMPIFLPSSLPPNSVSFRFHRRAHTQWSAHEGKPADCILSGTVASKARLRALNLTQIRV